MAAAPAVLMWMQIASAVVGVIGALRQGNAAANAAQYNAQVNQQNAQISREDAAAQALQADRETYLRLGAIRAAAGASGGASGEGSVLDVIGDVAAQSELNKQQILYRGEVAARGYTNTATLDTAGGEVAQTGSYLKAGSELLGGAVNYYKSTAQLATKPVRA